MNDQDIYLLFSEQFRLIDDNLDDLVRVSTTFAQANRIIEDWKQANLNYLRARNKLFSAHEAKIKDLVEDFGESQKAIEKALADLKDDATTIDKIAKVISIGVGIGKNLQESV